MRTHTKALTVALALAVALSLAGCHKTVATGVPTSPTPPQVTVAQYCQLGAHSAALASDTLIALWNAGKVNSDTFNRTRTYIKTADAVFRDVSSEAASADTWPVMRLKIAGIGARAGIASTVSDPALQAQLNGIVQMIQNILGVTQ